jgi:alkylation response protein AidB-like acyl-CoA dehydrogenase
MMRDARINLIGEGANDVLRSFISGVGMKPVADALLGVQNALSNPFKDFGKLWQFGRKQISARLTTPDIPIKSGELLGEARELGKRIGEFGLAVQKMLFRYREAILERQYVQERIADAACDLYASSCTLSRLDHLLMQPGNGNPKETLRDAQAGRYFLKLADRRIRQNLAALADNDDAETTAVANSALERD